MKPKKGPSFRSVNRCTYGMGDFTVEFGSGRRSRFGWGNAFWLPEQVRTALMEDGYGADQGARFLKMREPPKNTYIK